MQRKHFSAELTITAGERAVIASISTISVDRDGEVLIPNGCDASEFERSPTVFFNHDYTLPIGRCAGIRLLPDRLEAKTIFATRPEGHEGPWLADTVLSLLRQGVVNGFSVGFCPVEGRRAGRQDREQFGAHARYVHTRWKLIEYSVAPLPANQDALTIAVSKGMVAPEHAAMLMPRRRHVALIINAPDTADVHAIVRRQLLKARGTLYDNP